MGLKEKSIGRQRYLEHLCQYLVFVGNNGTRQNDKVRLEDHFFAEDSVLDFKLEETSFNPQVRFCIEFILNKFNPLVSCLGIVSFHQSIGSNVPIEDRHLGIWILFLNLQGIL